MAVKGKVGEAGYEEFDSRDFEQASSKAVDESASASEGDAKDDKKEEQATEEQADGEENAVDDAKDAGAADDAKDSEGTSVEESTKYEPNTKYKVYDQEREFPEWMKPLVTSKEQEDHFRDLLTKAEGLDEMKPRHQQTVQERDQARNELATHQGDIRRIVGLRQSNPDLFFAEVGVTDDMIVAAARRILGGPEATEAQQAAAAAQRQAAVDAYRQQQAAQGMQQQASQSYQMAHQQALEMALGHPEIRTFEQTFDQRHGVGAFRQQVAAHGNYEFQRTGKSITPMEAVKAVHDFHKGSFAAAAPAASAASATATGPNGRPVVTAQRPKALPNVGKGKNASPTQTRPRRISDLRKMAAELDSGES